jgi:hypothetical protein
LLGLVDDRKALGPYLKLVIQLSIITTLVVWGDLRALTALDSLGMGKFPSILITVLWIAGITNAFNFLDNMDGLVGRRGGGLRRGVFADGDDHAGAAAVVCGGDAGDVHWVAAGVSGF